MQSMTVQNGYGNMARKRKGNSQKTSLLPMSKLRFGFAKQDPDFREGYFKSVLRMGTCETIGQIEDIFNKHDNHIMFLRETGVIGEGR